MRTLGRSTTHFLGALALAGCAEQAVVRGSVVPTTPAPAEVRSTTKAPFAVDFERGVVPLRFGKALAMDSYILVTLSDKEVSCGGEITRDDAYAVEFELPPGPALSFFAGHPIGVPAAIRPPGTRLESDVAPGYLVDARIEPFQLVVNEHVRGTLEFELKGRVGRGHFDAEICPFAGREPTGLAADAGEHSLGGSFAGANFAYRTALAMVKHQTLGEAVDIIDRIELYAGDVTCENRRIDEGKRTFLSLQDISGANSRQRFTGSAQPALARFVRPAPEQGFPSNQQFGPPGAWVRFDELRFVEGGSVTGEAFAESSSPDLAMEGRIGGNFVATVCVED